MALEKRTPQPIDLTIRGEVLPDETGHVPALKALLIDLDRDITINVSSWPICGRRALVGYSTNPGSRNCDAAVIGGGTATVKTPSRSEEIPLVAYNGGVRGNTTTIFVLSYLEHDGWVLIKVTLAPSDEGPGLNNAAWTIPTLFGGAASLADFRLTLRGAAAPNSTGPSYVEARCLDGWLQATFEARFRPESDGETPGPISVASRSRCSPNAEQP